MRLVKIVSLCDVKTDKYFGVRIDGIATNSDTATFESIGTAAENVDSPLVCFSTFRKNETVRDILEQLENASSVCVSQGRYGYTLEFGYRFTDF